jgi:hypothetical protein
VIIAEMSMFPLGTGRVNTVIKVDERHDGEGRSTVDVVRSVEESETR